MVVGFISCSTELKDVEEAPRYYVKYIIGTQYIEAQGQLRNNKGKLIYYQNNGEYLYGPVDKCFFAYKEITDANKKTI